VQEKRDLIENLKPVRTFTLEDEGMTELVESMRKHGQQTPVLVFNGSTVLDGAKRISALIILGKEAIDTVTTDSMFEAVEMLGAAAEKNPPTTDRIVDFLFAVSDFTSLRRHRGTDKEEWYKRHPEYPVISQWGRQMLVYATGGVMSNAGLMRTSYLVNRVREGDTVAAEGLEQIRRGELSPHQARTQHGDSVPPLAGPTRNSAAQRQVLTNGTTNLAAAVESFNTLGAPLRVPEGEVEEALTRLAKARYDLFILMVGIKKSKERSTKS